MNKNQDQNSQSTTSGFPSQTELASSDTNTQGQSPSPIQSADESVVVFSYSRKDALADGVQLDVSAMAKEAGFTVPVFLTDTVFNEYVKVPEGVDCQDESGRLWDILWMLHWAIKQSKSIEARLPFKLFVRNDNRRARQVTLHAVCSARDIDDPSPSITIMLPDED